MAQPQARAGEKRGPGRPPKSATPAPKRLRTSIAAIPTPPAASPSTRSPGIGSPAPEKRHLRLPPKVADNKPLSNLPAPQPSGLSDDEYHTIAASGVLAASIERSRLNWTCKGLFKRYWTKPQTGKNAKPPPPGNPDVKHMKAKGECRLRIEPHIFEAEVYVEEWPKQPAAPKHFAPAPSQTPYGAPVRPPHKLSLPQHKPPIPNGHAPAQPIQRSNTPIQSYAVQQPRAQSALGTGSAQPEKKADPVISMLASRASSNAELKALMKEVATGNATQDQLKIFQRHIDELTGILSKQNGGADDPRSNALPSSDSIQYDGPSDVKPQPQPPPLQAAPLSHQQTPQPRPVATTTHAPPAYHQQPTWTTPQPPVQTTFPVILDFSKKTPGATEDRFLFPQHSVLEALSPQHLLVSFMLIRYGRDATDSVGLEPDTQYWQPVTMMVEVAYSREEILNCIRRWVKPLEEVRKFMEETMKTCTRAPETYLAVRLPVKGTVSETEDASKEPTPVVVVEEKPSKPKSNVKYVKRTSISKTAAGAPTKKSGGAGKEKVKEETTAIAVASSARASPSTARNDSDEKPATDGAADEPDGSESGRPRRAMRKSVRISES